MPDKPLIQVQASEAEQFLQGSTWMRYGPILMSDVLTEAFEMDEQRSPDESQVQSIHQVIKVTAIINPDVNCYFKQVDGTVVRVPLVPEAMMTNEEVIRDELLKDRQKLDWAIGGKVVLSSPAFRADLPGQRFDCDSNQGPKPLYAHVTRITGTSSFYVRFGIQTWVDPCASTLSPKFFHSHRYSMTHDVDGDTWLTTRSVTGHVKFRPEWLQAKGVNPGQIKAEYFHPVPAGFDRGNVKVQALSNGMEVAYSFVDREKPQPWGSLSPALKLSAEFSISSSLGEKLPLTQAAFHASAIGPKNQYRYNLLVMALKIANRKLQKPGHLMVTDIIITYSLDNTSIDLSMKALWKSVGIGPEGLQLNQAGLLADDDIGDLDAALSPFRADGEALQASQRHIARSPKMRNKDTVGTYTGIIIGSSLVNGCFNFTRPVNERWVPEINEATFTNTQGMTPEDLDPAVLDTPTGFLGTDGVALPFSLQVVTKLTLQMLATGLSSALINAIGWYREWKTNTSYRTNHQMAVMPIGAKQVASPGEATTWMPPQFGTLGEPYTLKVVDWSILWYGPDPSSIFLPSPDTSDDNDVILAEDISPAVPTICNSNLRAWRVSGTYWYGQKKLHTASLATKSRYDYTDRGFAVGKSIADSASQPANTIGLTRFVAGYAPAYQPPA